MEEACTIMCYYLLYVNMTQGSDGKETSFDETWKLMEWDSFLSSFLKLFWLTICVCLDTVSFFCVSYLPNRFLGRWRADYRRRWSSNNKGRKGRRIGCLAEWSRSTSRGATQTLFYEWRCSSLILIFVFFWGFLIILLRFNFDAFPYFFFCNWRK